MIRLAARIPGYWMFRRFGFPKLFPVNLTVSITYRCNSKCKTCRIYERGAREFSLDEYQQTFRSIGSGVFWITLSGGEPFLRKDIADICRLASVYCRPSIINIPTNGILTTQIVENTKKILGAVAPARVVINLSIDDLEERHDEIRGVPGNYDKALETYRALRELQSANLSVGIHTVISRYNVDRFPKIYEELYKLKPDAYITEIAEERVELGTVGLGIIPPEARYAEAIDYLSSRMRERKQSGLAAFTQSFREQYYKIVKATIHQKRQILPCYAGFMSAQISPDGDVWACCIKAESMGNLRDSGYSFGKVWASPKAASIRAQIGMGGCYCPLANASYTNMVASVKTASKVVSGLVRASRCRPVENADSE
jgi:MoaA/NifB/PqqE/SkfB family radical SAM enzyme